MAIGAHHGLYDDEQDPFESSFFATPDLAPSMQDLSQGRMAAAGMPRQPEAPAMAPTAPERDPFESSFFADSPISTRTQKLDVMAGGRHPRDGEPRPYMADAIAASSSDQWGTLQGSSRGAPRPTPGGSIPPPSAPGEPADDGYDYHGVIDRLSKTQDPRQRALIQDELARNTYAQLQKAGHEVKWGENGQILVDGRPYVIGDGAPQAPGPPPIGAPTGVKTPGTAPTRDALRDPNAWRTYGGGAAESSGSGLGGASDPQSAYDQLAGSIDPNAPPADMEAAIEAAFGHLPGYGGAYKESVMLNGRWYDLVRGYGAAGAAFQGLTPKGPSAPRGGSSSLFGADGLMSSVLSPFGGSGGGLAQGGAQGARGVDLQSSGLNPTILALLQQQQQAPEPEPLAPSYIDLLR